ncbi:MAG: right-handed parallel beta-helix repeat-containing protein [Bacteroidetes bacterium]|nr:right-handed parallel beta-helix repeat-containing protein [Bacteroidota bacterium]
MFRSLRALLPVLLSVLAACSLSTVQATTYYVSGSGNDANSGTSPTQAWRTLGRLDQVQYALQPGDQVLLQRGGVYRGTLPISSSGTSAAPLVFGSYGTGAAPVISGSTVVTGWEVYQGNIWRAPVADAVQYVFIGGQRMTLARYPNSGWLRMDNGGPTSLQDGDLHQPDGYWNGATAVIRASNWNYDLATISGFSNGTLTFPTIYDTPGSYAWGYFLCNKLSELDAPGEWYYDPTAGMLYLQAPGNADPNTLTVEASTRDVGALIGWNRQYVRIQDLEFRHQRVAGVRNDGGHYITVTNCTFHDMYHGIRSYGSNNTYSGSTYRDIYASGVLLIDDNTVFSGNTLTDIALVPGLGETSWGYCGIRTTGSGNQVVGNTLTNVGYTGIEVNKDALVKHNVLRNCLATLNDGGGIAFDNADGMIIRGNIVLDITGNLESSAPDFTNYEHISHGIYFGNTSIKNTVVQGNTVARCAGSGIHVDHTMASTGNAITDNVLFDNRVQLSVSDLSNTMGPAAVAPYYVAAYNETYSGNVLYSLTRDQLCMRQYNCHSAAPVDFGTFSNNRYFNPYNEMSLFVMNTFSGSQKYFTLERWRTERGEDNGSTRSPLQLNAEEVTAVLGDELVANGTFDYNVNGWGGWPNNAQVTHDVTYLDNGALKAYLPNNSVYPELSLRNPDLFPMQNGQWYRMRFSLQSNAYGQLTAAVKGQSQLTSINTLGSRVYPFDGQRRDIELVFLCGLDDQALVQFTNSYLEPTYWLDNVSLQRVQVAIADPHDRQVLLVNDQGAPQEFPLEGCWSTVDGAIHSGSITVPAFGSVVLVREPDASCSLTTGVDDLAAMGTADPGFAYPDPATAGGPLHFRVPVSGTLRLHGLSGALVREIGLGTGTTAVHLPADLAPGTYLLTATDKGRSHRQKLVIE